MHHVLTYTIVQRLSLVENSQTVLEYMQATTILEEEIIDVLLQVEDVNKISFPNAT